MSVVEHACASALRSRVVEEAAEERPGAQDSHDSGELRTAELVARRTGSLGCDFAQERSSPLAAGTPGAALFGGKFGAGPLCFVSDPDLKMTAPLQSILSEHR